MDIVLPQDTDTNILSVNTTLIVLEDQRYTALVSFSNLAGEFSNSSTVDFSKYISVLRKQFLIKIIIFICIFITINIHVY